MIGGGASEDQFKYTNLKNLDLFKVFKSITFRTYIKNE